MAPVCCPELRSYPVRFADAVCLLFVPGVFLLVHVVSCSGQGDVRSTKRLEGQACRTSLLVHVSTQDLTCCCHTTQRHACDIALHVLRLSCRLHSMLVRVWVSKFEGSTTCVHVRHSAVHMVGASCWESNVVPNVEMKFVWEQKVLISVYPCMEADCRVHTPAVTQQSVSWSLVKLESVAPSLLLFEHDIPHYATLIMPPIATHLPSTTDDQDNIIWPNFHILPWRH